MNARRIMKAIHKRRGRKKASRISVQSEKHISATMTRFKLGGAILTYRDLRQALNSKFGLSLSVGTVYRLARGYEPTDSGIRARLGLPVLKLAPVCPNCGDVHPNASCPKRRATLPETRKRTNWKRAFKFIWAATLAGQMRKGSHQ